jgi:hypothetical protein
VKRLTPMQRSCWRGKQRIGRKRATLVLGRFIEQEQRWLLRKRQRRPFLIPWTSNIYVRYTGYTWFSSVLDPNDWSVTGQPPPISEQE